MELASKGYVKACRDFFQAHSHEHEALHGHDLFQLSKINSLEHVQHNELARLYRDNKYRIALTRTTFNLLTYHIHENESQGGSVIIRFLNDHLDIKINQGHPTTIGVKDDSGLDEDEGIPGHTTSQRGGSGDLPHLKLGMLPMDKDFVTDVEDQLQQEDSRERQSGRQGELGLNAPGRSLIEEFKKIKREESEDSPIREDIPLPPYKGADIEREVRMVKESRNKFNLLGIPAAALPSVCMYTFHNSNDG